MSTAVKAAVMQSRAGGMEPPLFSGRMFPHAPDGKPGAPGLCPWSPRGGLCTGKGLRAIHPEPGMREHQAGKELGKAAPGGLHDGGRWEPSGALRKSSHSEPRMQKKKAPSSRRGLHRFKTEPKHKNKI